VQRLIVVKNCFAPAPRLHFMLRARVGLAGFAAFSLLLLAASGGVARSDPSSGLSPRAL
jgi:hypothetical protein